MAGRGRGKKIKEEPNEIMGAMARVRDNAVRVQQEEVPVMRGRGRGKRIKEEVPKLFEPKSNKDDSDVEEEDVMAERGRRIHEDVPKLPPKPESLKRYDDSKEYKELEQEREFHSKMHEEKKVKKENLDAMLKKELEEEEEFRTKMQNHKKLRKPKGSGFSNISVLDLLEGKIPDFETDITIDDVPEPEELVAKRTKAELERVNLFGKWDEAEEGDEAAELKKKYYEEMQKGSGAMVSGVNRFRKNLEVEKLQNLLDENACYDEIVPKMEPLTPDGGVRKRIMTPGMPGKPIRDGQIAYMNYQVWTEGSDAPLDDSRTHSKVGRTPGTLASTTYRFKVGCGFVLRAIDIAVKSMQIGEVAKVLANPEYAYGKLGVIGSVPPDTRVMITIELVDVSDGSPFTEFVDMEPSERNRLPFDTIYRGIEELKQNGKDYVEAEDYNAAKREYKRALEILFEMTINDDMETFKRDQLAFTLMNNIAFCLMKLGQNRRAKEYLEDAIDMPNVHRKKKVKAFYRYAKILFEMCDLESAWVNIDIAKGLNGADPDIDELYRTVLRKRHSAGEKEVEYARKMFQKL